MELQVTHDEGAARGEFAIAREGKRVGRMNYARDGDRVEILHTEVDPVLRGEGAGAKLVAAAVEWARTEQLQIVPLCTFAKSVFAKTPEYSDVLAGR